MSARKADLHAVVSGWLLGPHSGANRRLLALLAEVGDFLEDQERVTVLHHSEFSPPPLDRIEWQRFDLPTSPTWQRARCERRRVPDALMKLGATVYDHGFLPPPRVPVPTCLTVHDLRAVDGHTAWPRWLARTVLRQACRRVQAIITPSSWTAQRLVDIASTGPPPIVVPNAVTIATTPIAPLPRPQPANGYLLHVGHLERRKNLAVVIRALAQLEHDKAPQLWLAGNDAGAAKHLMRLARQLGVTTLVQQLGSVDEANLASLYHNARSVVMPSYYEGFGLPALEGLAHGRPVLAAQRTALPEVLGQHATLLPPEDVTAWANAMQSQPPDHAQARAERIAHATAHTWASSAQQWLAVWRDLHANT